MPRTEEAEARLLEEIEEKIVLVLEQLPLSTSLRTRAMTLRGQMSGLDAAAALGAVAEISGALREDIERERGEVQGYLRELDVRLGDLGTILSGPGQRAPGSHPTARKTRCADR